MRSEIHGPERWLLASKKPHIIELLKRAEQMTTDEITALDEKPDVIKGLLNIKKGQQQKDSAQRAEQIADLMMVHQHKI